MDNATPPGVAVCRRDQRAVPQAHLLELRQDIEQHRFELISVSEPWHKPATPNRCVPVPGYQLLRSDRPDGRGYGGVAVLVRNALNATVIGRPGGLTEGSKLETLWVQVRAGKRLVMLCSMYRPPVQTSARVTADLDELERQVQYILTRHSGLIFLTGDLNININLASNSSSTAANRLRELLTTYSMQQHISGPTYEPSGSTIDMICTNSEIVRSGTIHCDFRPHRWSPGLAFLPAKTSFCHLPA